MMFITRTSMADFMLSYLPFSPVQFLILVNAYKKKTKNDWFLGIKLSSKRFSQNTWFS